MLRGPRGSRARGGGDVKCPGGPKGQVGLLGDPMQITGRFDGSSDNLKA